MIRQGTTPPLTPAERRLLRVMRRPASPEGASIRSGLPLTEVEDDLRHMVAAGLVTGVGGAWRTTPRGEALAREAPPVDPVC